MVNFTEVDPSELDTSRLGRRGRVSYPLMKAFMERNVKLAKLDLEGLDKNPQYLRSVLTSYIKSHNLPVKIFSLQGEMYLERLDLNNDGTAIADYKADEATTEGAAGHERHLEAMPITGEEVDKRFREEKGKITK